MPLNMVNEKPVVNKAQEHLVEEKARMNKSLEKFGKIIGVHSGKGGVGKTLVATEMALLLAREGYSVGLLDADIDCPNIPVALGVRERMMIDDAGLLQPIKARGLSIASTGFLQDEGEPLIIRGPVKHRLLTDLIEKVAWGPLDFLIVDLPPGTGDVPLSVMQFLSLDKLFIVTTPQPEALEDAKRSALMASKLGVSVNGVISNFEGEIFGNTPASFSKNLGCDYLLKIPLSKIVFSQRSEKKSVFEHEEFSEIEKSLLKKILE